MCEVHKFRNEAKVKQDQKRLISIFVHFLSVSAKHVLIFLRFSFLYLLIYQSRKWNDGPVIANSEKAAVLESLGGLF